VKPLPIPPPPKSRLLSVPNGDKVDPGLYWSATYHIVYQRFTNQGWDHDDAVRQACEAADKSEAARLTRERKAAAAQAYRDASRGR